LEVPGWRQRKATNSKYREPSVKSRISGIRSIEMVDYIEASYCFDSKMNALHQKFEYFHVFLKRILARYSIPFS